MWSVPLFKTNIGKPDPITMAWIRNLEYPHEASGHDHTADKYILERPKLKKLKQQLKETCDFFVHNEMGVHEDINFEIQNSWINRHQKGENNTLHWHSNAMLSAVYYIQNEPNAGDILFRRSHLYYNLFHDTVRVPFQEDSMNQYNMDTIAHKPVSGDLLIFPSHCEHMVTQNETTSERYSLAFNLFARGEIGEGTSVIKL
tara:strand:+ start:3841 stop:4443 length:603 start_codon:yes stop_codon:yes gene_type:complete